jgi:hypothetical protein
MAIAVGTIARDNRAKPINIFFGFIFSPEPTTFFGINNINLQIGAEVVFQKKEIFFSFFFRKSQVIKKSFLQSFAPKY